MATLLLKNGNLVDPSNGIDTESDLLIVEGRIEKIGRNLKAGPGVKEMDLRGKVVSPGFFDMHVHFREPGFEHKETIATGCASAAAGGFTGVCCMPNTNPPIDDATVVSFIHEKGRTALNGAVDVFCIGAVTKGREGKLLAPMADLAGAGVVAFSDDGSPVSDPEIMRRALEYAGMFGKPIIQHAEESSMTRGGAMNEGPTATVLGLPAIPPVAEEIMVGRDILLAKYVGAQYHVAHISTRGTLEQVRAARSRGIAVTCEITPHHFTLSDDAVDGFDTNTKMNPPLRSKEDLHAMKEGLRDGTIDAIATDHAPHSRDEKQVEYVNAPFGIVGLETAIGLTVTELLEPGVISLPRMVELMSINPRKILHLPPVGLKEGTMANLTIFDTVAKWTVDAGAFRSKSKNSPFNGYKLRGRAVGIVNNGQAIFS
ncbi:MAG TPA: dihydroorotase [Bacteroidota bacterium]|nr:dihydroorotase [Bacteroidota bacterium]